MGTVREREKDNEREREREREREWGRDLSLSERESEERGMATMTTTVDRMGSGGEATPCEGRGSTVRALCRCGGLVMKKGVNDSPPLVFMLKAMNRSPPSSLY